MFIVNKFFLPFLYSLYLNLHQKHQKKFLVCENLLGNKSDSDSDSYNSAKCIKQHARAKIFHVGTYTESSWLMTGDAFG